MQSIPQLLNDIVTGLRSIPELVQDCAGDEQAIQAYSAQTSLSRSVEGAVDAMATPSILVAHDASELEPTGPWSHKFVIYLRSECAEGDSSGQAGTWEMIQHIVDGKPDGLTTWVETDLNTSTEPPTDVQIGRSLYARGDNAEEQYVIGFSIRERIW